jgi:hypothetical protein
MDIGDMDTCCVDCGALIWYEERAEKHRGKASLKISICCKKGKITIPFMEEPPPLLRSLFNGLHAKSSNFIFNIRSYNNMFSFTSLGGRGVPHTCAGCATTPGLQILRASIQNFEVI